jgi:hypothetical protein
MPSPCFEAVSWARWAGLGRLGGLQPTSGPASSFPYFFSIFYFTNGITILFAGFEFRASYKTF